jgi:hypothetical protein
LAWQQLKFQRARAQARSRDETWNLEFEPWLAAWQGRIDESGRGQNDWCLLRKDPDQPWQADNLLTARRHHQLRFKNILRWAQRHGVSVDLDRLFEATEEPGDKETIIARSRI